MRRRYLAAYDIRDPRRLRRVHAMMKGYGWAMQYSVFICDLDPMELMRLRMDIAELVKHDEDSIAVIDLGDPRERGRECFEFIGVSRGLPSAGPVII